MDMLAIRPFSSVLQIAEGRRRKTQDELVGRPDGTSDTLFSREGVRLMKSGMSSLQANSTGLLLRQISSQPTLFSGLQRSLRTA